MKRFLLFIVALCWAVIPSNAAKRALLIGISEYPEYNTPYLSWNDIHGANDADLLCTTLQKQKFIVNTLKTKEATAYNIRKAIKDLTNKCRKGDLVLLHFSGHGQPYEDFSHDEGDGWDESIVPYDAGKNYIKGVYEGKNHIIDDELHEIFNSIRKKVGTTGFVYVILDACHAGDISRYDSASEETDTIPMRGTTTTFTPRAKNYAGFKIDKRRVHSLEKQPQMGDICILEACMSHQASQEILVGGTYYGPLSYNVNKVLSHHLLTSDIKWVDQVRTEMDKLKRQDMVVETSVK